VRVFLVRAAILILPLVFSSPLEAEIFQWTDDNGRTHYSDQPKSKNYDWVEEDEKSYFSYQPPKELKDENASILPSAKAAPRTSRRQKKYRPGLSQAPTGGVTALPTPAPRASTEGSYTRQTSTTRTSTARSSSGRSSAGQTSGTRTTSGGY